MLSGQLTTAGELARLLLAYRPDAPIIVSPDNFNAWTLRIYEKNGVLCIQPYQLLVKKVPL